MLDRDEPRLRSRAIKAGADEASLVKRPLSWDEWQNMPDEIQHWHCVGNSQSVDAVHEAHSSTIASVRAELKSTLSKIHTFEVEDVPALANAFIENGGQFSNLFPQFIGSRKNTDRVLKYLRENELLPEVDNFIIAFKSLAHEGEISIDASQTGLTDDSTELTGERLQAAINSNPLLLSQATPDVVESRRVMRMDSKSFAEWERKAKGPQPLPFVIEQRVKQAFTTLAANHPEFRFNIDSNKERLLEYLNKNATTIDSKNVEAAFVALKNAGELSLNEDVVVRGENVTWTDYSMVEPNKHLTSRQESLKYKIKNMTADEFQEFIANPTNRRAVDNL
jgi:hypothetical protein